VWSRYFGRRSGFAAGDEDDAGALADPLEQRIDIGGQPDHLAVHRPCSCTGAKALRNQATLRRQAAKFR
jgi:hypothetical protein